MISVGERGSPLEAALCDRSRETEFAMCKIVRPAGGEFPRRAGFRALQSRMDQREARPSLPAYLRRIPAVLRWLELDARFSSSSTALDAFLLEEEEDFLPDDERLLPEAFAA